MAALLSDHEIIERVLAHIERRTTDVGTQVWREPVENYRSPARLQAELDRILLRIPAVFCPSSALAERGSFVAREVSGRPIVAVRGEDGVVRAFKNVCRHRGMRVASESGCTRVFICGYHGWTYGLDGHLRHVPHEEGFPGLDRAQHGLAPLTAIERQGMVFVAQEPGASPAVLDDLPDNLDLSGMPCSVSATENEANWKIVLEGFLEGYHIRATHPQSFLPYGFDNLNVVECSGRHSRVTFPFQRIRKLAQVPPEQRCLTGFVTSVYQLFPNALITVLSSHTNLIVLEPIGVERTNVVRYTFTNSAAARAPDAVRRDTEFVATGAAEDRAVVCAIQRGLASGANDSFVFGHFESAIVHFHRTLAAALEQSAGLSLLRDCPRTSPA